nr:glycosyltransferase family 4 protein [Corynebacterium sp. 13CS0277]
MKHTPVPPPGRTPAHPRVLLVTNDFPPTVGGIQSYLADFLRGLDPARVVVFASTQDAVAASAFDAEAPYTVVRSPHRVLLPTPSVRRAMQQLIREHAIDVVWFGAAAPLGLLGRAAREAGARRVVASTHGHEVGWSMIPGARQLLRRIGDHADVVTFISDYTLGRLRAAFGPAPQWQRMPSGVDADYFHPLDEQSRARVREELAQAHGIPATAPLVVCCSRLVPRKGQDTLLQAWPEVHAAAPDAHLLFVGEGSYRRVLTRRAASLPKEAASRVHFAGRIPRDALRDVVAASTLSAIPCRTRGGGLDVEGLGIVFLEAQACGVPVIAGDSGGAPETIGPGCGVVVPGGDAGVLSAVLQRLLLASAAERAAMGQRGREHVLQQWNWELQFARLHAALGGPPA